MNVVAVLSIIHGISARIIEVFIFLAPPMMLVVASLRISPAVLTGEEKVCPPIAVTFLWNITYLYNIVVFLLHYHNHAQMWFCSNDSSINDIPMYR